MDVHRFIIKAYPTGVHPEFHMWQKATLVLFVANPDPYIAEQMALDELKRRCWVPEEIKHRDTLIREVVQKQGGEVWDAYVQAEQGKLFWLEDLDSLPMCKKGEELWGTGPRLTEAFVDNLIENSGGHRLTAEEAGEFREKNADYVLSKYVLELKHFENEGLSVETRQQKIGELFQRYFAETPVRKIDPYTLSDRDFQEYWEIVGVPIQKRIKAASKQVKTTIARLGPEQYEGGVILLNTGYLTVPHDFLVAMAERYASKDTSTIRHVIVISSWTITNGFDTVVNYGFHPREPTCSDLQKLRDVFWGTVEKLMTQMITGELDSESGMQQPMSPVYFNHQGEMFTFGVPQLESSFKRGKK
ncbi:MAG: hypothetical protein JRL30_25105 [Deltaproteobacteria bacterium]|nr:hypothetical protein [Deltaproteobacteria bacterium]